MALAVRLLLSRRVSVQSFGETDFRFRALISRWILKVLDHSCSGICGSACCGQDLSQRNAWHCVHYSSPLFFKQIFLWQSCLWSANSNFIPDLCLRWMIFMPLLINLTLSHRNHHEGLREHDMDSCHCWKSWMVLVPPPHTVPPISVQHMYRLLHWLFLILYVFTVSFSFLFSPSFTVLVKSNALFKGF